MFYGDNASHHMRLSIFSSFNEITNVKGLAQSLAHSWPPQHSSSLLLPLLISCFPCFLSEVISEKNPESASLCSSWSLPMQHTHSAAGHQALRVHYFMCALWLALHCWVQRIIFTQAAFTLSTTCGTNGVLLYWRKKYAYE